MSAEEIPPVDASPGAVTAARGYRAGVTTAGIKESERVDLGLLVSERVATAAAMFTQNVAKAAPVLLDQEHIREHRMRAVIVNSGNANAATGARGLADARRTAELTAQQVGCERREVFVLSTGIIGRFLPVEKIVAAIPQLTVEAEGGAAFARAMLTTDTFAKEARQSFACNGRTYIVGGCAKGAGMIHPDMATMLAVLTTDAPVSAAVLERALRRAVERSFNMISVDGDTSTNDTVVILANGAGGGGEIDGREAEAVKAFGEALGAVCRKLAIDIAKDGEGATKLIEAMVSGARTWGEARQVARSIVRSPLLKAALSKGDPNWGRALMAAGNAGVSFDLEKTRLWIGETLLFAEGSTVGVPEAEAAKAVGGERVRIRVDLGHGQESATAWGCDLTEEYVRFNADYVT